ncbi:MAG TPA: histidinol-phosphate transaminase [Vicinamibacterales bacterium]|jgi:histidinol-phosphate aminotransferase|nr:histidinol-phosphate transaminase [Vicinamibacterales bacterium]
MTYSRPPDREDALRLHLNENTGGCSHAVIDAIRQITAEEVARYPDYSALSRECADYLGVRENQLVLTNGLDEGLLASTVSAFRVMQGSTGLPEALIPQPAFEMFQVYVAAAGGRVVPVAAAADFAFPTRAVCDAITDRTRIIFLTSPNNPTGQLIPREALREIARSAPPDVTIIIDEAYHDFCGETFLPEIDAHPNVIIGRTFAKAHGLAGLRAGCLIGDPGRIDIIRSAVPPYSVSVFAVAGWRAALRDREYLSWYCAQVQDSRELLYAACEELHLPYWRSAGNFVLVNVGAVGDPEELVEALAARGILVRDRSKDPGCGGCIRITAGLVRHTETVIEALEGLCAVP